MAVQRAPYTTQLQAGLGLINETKMLLELWTPGMTASQLYDAALQSGRFPSMSARRLRNLVVECFAPRYLVAGGRPAQSLKRLAPALRSGEFAQFLFLFTCRANRVLGDFVRQVFWPRYAGGYTHITNDDARLFIERAVDDGKTSVRWSETTVRRVSAYLTGCCADYGLLESGLRSSRRILSFQMSPAVAAFVAHELHFDGFGDNALLSHEDWLLFGLTREDVLEEVKRISLRGLLIVQAAGDTIRISWKYQDMEALCDVLAKG